LTRGEQAKNMKNE